MDCQRHWQRLVEAFDLENWAEVKRRADAILNRLEFGAAPPMILPQMRSDSMKQVVARDVCRKMKNFATARLA
jgi:hypothetical protein